MRSDLFCLQCQLDENLLQFFVDKVDAKLLEAILFEYLEAVDVKNAQLFHFRHIPRHLECVVDFLKFSFMQSLKVS